MAANASPLATLIANTAKGNRRRAASGSVCSNTSAYPRTTVERGRPGRSTSISSVNKPVLKPAATSASALSNNQDLAGSRRDPPAPLARSFMR
jgi:hypothetical protein